MFPYMKYSDYLKAKYGERVYKLPINIPATCPNRDGTLGIGGCIYCGENGVGMENLPSEMSVENQLRVNMDFIGKRYKAKKFIAYFQNFCNTYMEPETFRKYIYEACVENVVQINVSTRPDCVADEYLEILKTISQEKGINIGIELGLQTANPHTLKTIGRGHGLAEFIDAVLAVKRYGFELCVHVIIDLPWDDEMDVVETARIISVLCVDCVKLHSLYVVIGTDLEKMVKKDEIKLLSSEEYIDRAIMFLENLRDNIAIQRIIGRAKREFAPSANFGMSWWKIKDTIDEKMMTEGRKQGSLYNSPKSNAVRKFL